MFIPNSQYHRLNLNGQHLVVAANPNPPMFYGETNATTGEFVPSHGIDVTFINTMASFFNFTWSLSDQHGEWGLEPNPETSAYDGLLGAVMSGNATFGIGAVSIRLRTGKEHLIEFTAPNMATRITFLTLEQPRVPLTGVLLLPFNALNWAIVVGLLLAMVGTGFACSVLLRSELDFAWLVFAAFMQRAPHIPTQHTYAGQSLIQLAYFAGLVLLTAYGGILISFLSRSFKFGNIDRLSQFNELIDQGKLTPLLVASSTFVHDFRKYGNSSFTYRRILRTMEEVDTYRDGLVRMTADRITEPDRRYALVGQFMTMQKWVERLGEAYFHLNDDLDACICADSYGLVFRAGSNLTLHFDRFIRVGTEAGLFERWSSQKYNWSGTKSQIRQNLTNFTADRDYDTRENAFSYDQLELHHLWEHFYLLFIGSTVALLALLGEIALWLFKHDMFG